MAGLDVLGIAGSLRRESHNRALLRLARDAAPAGVRISVWEGLGGIPLYDGDVEARGFPQPVVEMADAMRAAGAVLVVTPEYSHSVPGVLKNALDWAARPPGKSPLRGKVVAIAGASSGAMGTVRAQADLRRVLAAMGAFVVPGPDVLVANAQDKRGPDGSFTDEATRTHLARLLAEIPRWVERLAGPGR